MISTPRPPFNRVRRCPVRIVTRGHPGTFDRDRREYLWFFLISPCLRCTGFPVYSFIPCRIAVRLSDYYFIVSRRRTSGRSFRNREHVRAVPGALRYWISRDIYYNTRWQNGPGNHYDYLWSSLMSYNNIRERFFPFDSRRHAIKMSESCALYRRTGFSHGHRYNGLFSYRCVAALCRARNRRNTFNEFKMNEK